MNQRIATETDPRFAYRRDGQLKHSDRCRMAFGRLDPENCARCAERAAEREQGVAAREHAGFEQMRRRETADMRRSEEIRHHFRHEHSREKCGPVCTFGDW
jgi:hypothetical protein